jgi:FKBP-type peptidyl-prolyl cis-trans isomerase
MKNHSTRRATTFCVLTALAPLCIGLQAPFARAAAPADQAAYTLGLNLGQQLRQDGVTHEIPINRIVAGIKDGLAGKKAQAADLQELQAFLGAALEAAVARNAAAAKAFLERNATEQGVMTTPSGLQYRILEAGDEHAAPPRPTDLVTLRYRGTFMDGTEFDSSAKHNGSAPLAVNNLMKAWQEALVLMKPGAKWQLFVAPELGYGMGARPNIPGGSLLIFEIGLVSVAPPVAPPPKVD